MTDPIEEPVKRKRGRPKLEEGEKGSYNVSRRVKARRDSQRKLSAAKRRANKQSKKLNAMKRSVKRSEESLKTVENAIYNKDGSKVLEESVLEQVPASVKELVEDEAEVIFKPNSGPQTDFLASPERDVFYGGAAGGGKSFALLADLLRYCGNSNHRALLIRRTLDELTELINKSRDLFSRCHIQRSKIHVAVPIRSNSVVFVLR